MLHADLLHIDKFYQYLVDDLLNLITHLCVLIQKLQLLIFCMDDLEYVAILDYVLFFFFICTIIKINHFTLDIALSNSAMHTFPTFMDMDLMLYLKFVIFYHQFYHHFAILLISAVYTL